jgi:hypothetical protein
LAAYTVEASQRASWYVAHRLHQVLENQAPAPDAPISEPVPIHATPPLASHSAPGVTHQVTPA